MENTEDKKVETRNKIINLSDIQIDILSKIISEKSLLLEKINKLEEREADFSSMILDFIGIDKSKVIEAKINNTGKEFIVTFNV